MKENAHQKNALWLWKMMAQGSNTGREPNRMPECVPPKLTVGTKDCGFVFWTEYSCDATDRWPFTSRSASVLYWYCWAADFFSVHSDVNDGTKVRSIKIAGKMNLPDCTVGLRIWPDTSQLNGRILARKLVRSCCGRSRFCRLQWIRNLGWIQSLIFVKEVKFIDVAWSLFKAFDYRLYSHKVQN